MYQAGCSHNSKTVAHVSTTNLKRCGLVLVILGVGAEVVDVERRQSGDEQFKLLLVEDGNEPLGNDAVEAVEERLQLLLYRTRHLHLTHQLHILLLVLLRHTHVPPVRLQVADFCHTKFLNLQPTDANTMTFIVHHQTLECFMPALVPHLKA